MCIAQETPEVQDLSIDLQSESGELYDFQADVTRVMDIFINSLYTHKDIFLRETISNGSDALDKVRYMAITDDSVLKDNKNLELRVEFNTEEKTLSVTDTGVGMTKEDLIKNLGTVAKSGTTQFVEALASGGDINLIGQFGVGFYSNFLVAEEIIVTSKHNQDDQHVWVSRASNTFKVFKDPRGNTLGRGTRVTIKLKQDSLDFLNEDTLRKIVKKYSEFVQYPIYLKAKKESDSGEMWDWELINENKPIWLRENVEEEDYNNFYKTLTRDTRDPLSHIHFTAEGDVEFKALMYIPSEAPGDMFRNYNSKTAPIKLYVRRVLITEEFHDLIPRYLSFVRGVVDSDDLPLNVARENIQHQKIIKLINKKLTRKILQELVELSEIEYEEDEVNEYLEFYKKFGKHIKLGVMEDASNKSKLSKLLRYYTTHSPNELISLDDYVDRMKENQEDIYYIAGENQEKLLKSPIVQKLVNLGYEVILLTDPIDEYSMNSLNEYEKHHIQNISNDDWELPEEDEDLARRKEKALNEHYKTLLDWLKGLAGGKVFKVTLSRKLYEEPSIVTSSGDDGQSANLERIQRSQTFGRRNEGVSHVRKIWELNPAHPLIKRLDRYAKNDPNNMEGRELAASMLDVALLQSGFMLPDSVTFYRVVQRLIQEDMGIDLEEGVKEPYVDVSSEDSSKYDL